MRNGVNWFFWIAGLSIINSILYFVGSSFTFVIGLGATQFVDGIVTAIANRYTSGGFTFFHLIGFIVDLLVAGIFILFGYLGKKRLRWAIIIGMILYTLDAIIFIWVGAWLSVAFHGLGLWGLWQGLRSLNGLVLLEKTTSISSTENVVTASSVHF